MQICINCSNHTKFILNASSYFDTTFEFFTGCTKLEEMALLYSKKLPPVGLNLMQEITTGLGGLGV